MARIGGEFFDGTLKDFGWKTNLAHVKAWPVLPFRVDIALPQWQKGRGAGGNDMTVVDCACTCIFGSHSPSPRSRINLNTCTLFNTIINHDQSPHSYCIEVQSYYLDTFPISR